MTAIRTSDAPGRTALTLIEMLCVLAIVGILASLLLSTMRAIRTATVSTKCLGNLRNVGVAMRAYAGDNQGQLPPVTIAGATWCNERFIGGYAHEVATAGQAISTRSVFQCPADDRWRSDAWSQANQQSFTPFGGSYPLMPWAPSDWSVCTRLGRIAKPAITVFALDAAGAAFHPGWGSPPPTIGDRDGEASNWSFGVARSYYNWIRRHRNGCNAVFIDGHASFRSDLQRDAQTAFDAEVRFYP